MNTGKLAVVSLSLAVVAGSVWYVTTYPEQQPEEPVFPGTDAVSEKPSQQVEGASETAIVGTVGSGETEEPFADSLRGTDVDGRLAVDDDGNLKANREARDYFDYFLSAVGERSLEEVIEHIEQQAHAALPGRAADQAVNLLHDYVDYRKAEQEYMGRNLTAEQQRDHVETLDSTLETLMHMRRSHMGGDRAEAFFGVEEEYGHYALDRMRVERNPDLSEGERQARLAEIDDRAPSEITEVRERTTGHVAREQRVEEMREAGASQAEIDAYRARHVGEEEAERMSEIDQQNAQWEASYDRYAEKRSRIEASEGLSPESREAEIKRLRETHFDKRGQRRAQVRDQAREPQG